jgi:hypothetical protein
VTVLTLDGDLPIPLGTAMFPYGRKLLMALVELKNSLIAEGRYTDPVDELLVKFVD